MAEEKFSEYTQNLYDTVISLRQEVDNLRTAYTLIQSRLEKMATLSDKSTADAVKGAIDIEELARLAVVAAEVAHKAAVVLLETGGIEKTQKTLDAASRVYESSQDSTTVSKARQTGGGALKKNNSVN
jgi:hypothetical protein